MLSIINDFKEYINNNFEGHIPNLIYFAFGIVIGIIFFLIMFLIVFLISRKKNKNKTIKPLPINENYKNIIQYKIDIFSNYYANEDILIKLKGFGSIIIELCEEISTLYYPDSEDPMFEVSLNQLADTLQYCINRIDYIVDKILVGKLGFVDIFTKKPLKDIKLGFLLQKLNKPKEEPKPTLFSSIKKKFINIGKKTLISSTKKTVNQELIELIEELGEDINNLYSKQNVTFSKKYRKKKKGSDLND